VIGEPTRRLAPNARWRWRIQQVLFWLVALVVALIVAGQVDAGWVSALSKLPLVGLVVGTAAVPELRWRRWRWDVDPAAVVIRHGTFTVTETLVPMVRVQHVDTTSDIIEQALDLSTVVIHTAAGSHKIPLLSVVQADELRDRIAELARTPHGA
jgi:membrane protein YdbS with pleckstrin-like domain